MASGFEYEDFLAPVHHDEAWPYQNPSASALPSQPTRGVATGYICEHYQDSDPAMEEYI